MPTVSTSTRQDKHKTDEYGIERSNADEPGFVDKYRAKWSWFDHIMRMNERYGEEGGNQYSAGITYFSVLSMFPLLMLIMAIAASMLAQRPDLLAQLQEKIVASVDGSIAETLTKILDTAIAQRGAMFGIGGLTALWSGLGWMSNLRYGASKMWCYPVTGENFFKAKLQDLLGLVGLIFAFMVAFGVTAIGSSGLTERLLVVVSLDKVPGIFLLTFAVSILLGLIANFCVFLWMLKYLPRGEVPMKSAVRASIIGAVLFEVFKQLAAQFFSNALNNPAGATFGPIIGVMVLFYFVWRILMYCSAWAATTEESLAIAKLDVPAPAVIRVREEVRVSNDKGKGIGIGVATGAVAAAIVAALRKK
ncbi:inner membrane protein YhjD [Corynebacterium pseudotuberculosis FRC41]|uniref:YhjD/YihY/BrkB family envelope integrity protein n=1 Tax=Corynebacterium pseudotuberculosis TaxID=1719 RepID=UPI0001DD8532|nr:YhjD/YihY/BrkB family envelope integrity protein [Corynebacterium pseudotuberculosis]ADK28260.1 inner membrane protein YhjD [Corynebacterium pseudotuberculosis FRC41]